MLPSKSYDPETICQIFEKGNKVKESWRKLFVSVLKNPAVKVPAVPVYKMSNFNF